MPSTYSQDLRDRVLAAADRGMPTKRIAETFAVSPAWVRRLKQRRRETGETAARKRGSPGVPKIDRGVLAALVAEQRDATGPELRDRLAERTGVRVTDSAISMALKQLGFTFKKKDAPHRGAGPPRRRRATHRVEGRPARPRPPPADLHRRDPLVRMGPRPSMTRLRGRAQRGERLIDKTPHGHWKTSTLIAALGVGGVR